MDSFIVEIQVDRSTVIILFNVQYNNEYFYDL